MQNLSDSRDCAFEAFITNLGKYNEGELVGEWVKFPITNEEMQEVFKRIGINHRYEELFITDYDCTDTNLSKVLGEYESLSELNYLANQMMELDESESFWESVLDLGEYTGSVRDLINLTENMDCFDFLPNVNNDYDLGYYWIEESGCYDTKAMGALSNYIDYAGFGRDIQMDESGLFTDHGYIRMNGSHLLMSMMVRLRASPKNIVSHEMRNQLVTSLESRTKSRFRTLICTFDIVSVLGYSI